MTVTTTLETAEQLTVIGETIRPMLTGEMGSAIEVYDTTGDEGMGPPPHVHAWDEVYVMLEGSLEVTVGDAPPQVLRAGMCAHVPGGTAHGYRIAEDDTHFLTLLSAGGGHAFYRQMDAEVSFPPDPAEIVRVATGHGIAFPG